MLGLICTQPNTQGAPLHISGILFLCSILSSLVLCWAISLCFIFSESALSSIQFIGLHLGSLSCTMAGKLFQGSKLGDYNHRAHLIFLIFRFHCLSLAGVQRLENYCFIYCPSLIVSGKKVDLVTVTSSWQEVEGSSPPPQPPLACS